MTSSQIGRLVRLHAKAERRENAYKRLSLNRSAQSKGPEHLRKAERLYSQVSGLIRDFTPDIA